MICICSTFVHKPEYKKKAQIESNTNKKSNLRSSWIWLSNYIKLSNIFAYFNERNINWKRSCKIINKQRMTSFM